MYIRSRQLAILPNGILNHRDSDVRVQEKVIEVEVWGCFEDAEVAWKSEMKSILSAIVATAHDNPRRCEG